MTKKEERLVDRWFPVAAVDDACGGTAGSGLVEKAIFTWFASRPIAQARAACLTALLPNRAALKPDVERAIRVADRDAVARLSEAVVAEYGGKAPLVLDFFSGRGMIPLEASRAGANAIGFDLSPVATLAGRLLADYPARDWSLEVTLPFEGSPTNEKDRLHVFQSDRLANDVEILLREVGTRVAKRMEAYYPRNDHGNFPWGYLWAITIACDECKRRFPLVGSLVLRHPYNKNSDQGQSMRLATSGDAWSVDIMEGPPTQKPTYSSGFKADGKKKKGKTARCTFCDFVHTLDVVKAKGISDGYEDALILVVDTNGSGERIFRVPTDDELLAVTRARGALSVHEGEGPYSAIPDERVSAGNVHSVMASGYGYKSFGKFMCDRQTLSFIETVAVIREVVAEARAAGCSEGYARALAGYAASTMCRRLRYSTRGVRLRPFGSEDGSKNNNVGVGDLFTNESKVNFQFDWLETGLGDGSATWQSTSASTVRAIRKIRAEKHGTPVRFGVASATALPLRDGSIDVVITDPPYYDMIEYADASDLFFVWLKRVLFDVEMDLFGPEAQTKNGLQNKNDEIIVRRVHEPMRVRHDTAFYEDMLAKSFGEAKRVLKPDGHLVVMFGHSDPDAWRRLLGALQTAEFVVTSAWPSRTETANTGVASIKVTVTIGCRVAPVQRPVGMGSEVDREVVEAVTERLGQWDADGLALEDQLMASYGPAMEVYGRYARVLNPDGTNADLDHYLALARRAVRDAMRLRVDEIPIETFDAVTRFAIFWLRAKGRSDVTKGEARFFAQADELRLDELRGRVLSETGAGFRMDLQDGRPLGPAPSLFEVVRAMAHAWDNGGMEAVSSTIALAKVDPGNPHLWAVVGDLASRLPASDKTAKALAGIKRSSSSITMLVADEMVAGKQTDFFEKTEA